MFLPLSLPFVTAASLALVVPGRDTLPSVPPPTGTAVTVRFVARVGTAPFVCGRDYPGLGASSTAAAASEFMLYVSNVRLLRADGSEVPLTLTDDGVHQRNNTSLLDFAAGGIGTDCTNASADTNTALHGTIAEPGDFTGIRFVLGVPFADNHQDQSVAPAPFNSSRMFWSWNGGYKFVRLDLITGAQRGAWFVHLGSVGCTPGGGPAVVPTRCAEPNAPTITLTGFDPLRAPIIADVARLLATADLAKTKGCMSNRASPGCPAILRSFGVMPDGANLPPQRLFHIE
jgi:uncharacterized repeat protein (TIGR04052 family)